jgi:hypothetical protein
MKRKTIHNYEPEEVIAEAKQELLMNECDPFNLTNFIDLATDSLHQLKNKAALETALNTHDTAEIGRIVMSAVEDFYNDLAEHWATERYENHELDHKYEE